RPQGNDEGQRGTHLGRRQARRRERGTCDVGCEIRLADGCELHANGSRHESPLLSCWWRTSPHERLKAAMLWRELIRTRLLLLMLPAFGCGSSQPGASTSQHDAGSTPDGGSSPDTRPCRRDVDASTFAPQSLSWSGSGALVPPPYKSLPDDAEITRVT